MSELADRFAELDATRAANARLHSIHDILVIALCTVISGGQAGADMELFGQSKREMLQSFRDLENGIPSHDTFSCVPGMLDPKTFGEWFVKFVHQFAQDVPGTVAVDGKTLCRSYDGAQEQSALHLVSAWGHAQHQPWDR